MNKFEVRNMDLYYGSFHALKNINIDIPEKEITAFIGPSGCGKSTFLKSLNRMNDLVEGCRISGDIKLDGVDIYKDKMDVNVLRKRVGMVFQKPNPFPMSIYDNIAYGPRTHGIHNKAQLDEIVERSLRGAAIWDEVKDRLNKLGHAVVRRTLGAQLRGADQRRAANLLQRLAQLRLEQDDHHDHARVDELLKHPVDNVQLQNVAQPEKDEQHANSLEYGAGAGAKQQTDDLIDDDGHQENVQKIPPIRLLEKIGI